MKQILRTGTPVVIYILEGDVSVDYDGHGTKTYRAGDAFVEAVSVPHRATNVGKTPVRILATFLEAVPASLDPGR
ncbi:MAG TPA: cupin domain-containing protein [Anaeromyxobacteraceae bacterium]|nr:cupin domain-containing protein [Anaeromyxobacteraceae bacterium]